MSVCQLAGASEARAQTISVKTVRVTEGDFAGFRPSTASGLGTLLTMPDTLLDPFNNPATASRVNGRQVAVSLTNYFLSHDLGNGRTTPVTLFAPGKRTFAVANLARQRVSTNQNFAAFNEDPSERNSYGFGLFGVTLGSTSVGVSLGQSQLTALDGAEILYPGVSSIDRSAGNLDFRLGATHEWAGRTRLEAVVLRSRSWASHGITYLDRSFDPNTQQVIQRTRIENDEDRSVTLGAHLAASRSVVDSTWRVGAAVTANRIEHTTLPTLGAMSIKRDPGQSSAFNGILGVSRSTRNYDVGVDAIYEPIWSRVTLNGKPNDDSYRFNNAALRGGAGFTYRPSGAESSVRVQFGAQAKAIRYSLEALDSTQTLITTKSSWNEYMHNWGVSFLDRRLALHMQWRVLSGTRRPGFAGPSQTFGFSPFDISPFAGGQQSSLVATRVSTMQITLTVPTP